MGLPLLIQEQKTIASAPRFTISFALGIAFFPGHPPQLTKPTISTGPDSSKAPKPLLVTLKSVVPGHMASVCLASNHSDFHDVPSKSGIKYKSFIGGAYQGKRMSTVIDLYP